MTLKQLNLVNFYFYTFLIKFRGDSPDNPYLSNFHHPGLPNHPDQWDDNPGNSIEYPDTHYALTILSTIFLNIYNVAILVTGQSEINLIF